MDKLIKDGKVAVLVSRGFGAGWSSWGAFNPFDPVIAKALLDGASSSEVVALSEQLYPEEYHGGAADLHIEWLDQGTAFYIDEYDGSEDIVTTERFNLVA
jgi:hypothetical protein